MTKQFVDPDGLNPPLMVEDIEVTVYRIPEEYIIGMNSLVISDIHFTSNKNLSESLPIVAKKTLSIILQKKITSIFMLGDIVENRSHTRIENLELIFNTFDKFGIPIFAIAGNHDRRVFKDIKYKNRFTNIHVILDSVMLLEHPNPEDGTIRRVLLSHNFMNDLWTNNVQSKVFAKRIKQVYNYMVKPDDFLLIGHVHIFNHDKENRCASLGTFSYDKHKASYAIISESHGFKIDFFNEYIFK
ncbi:Ser/Thr protein phosphatase [Tritrichomonas foetus]|uniref:Ser/Thr protein phosphatase n=1 Tax=Tritrichomonas foetus TaxID=1144522 RepID=A0A1J4JZM9_9EUKA|nr:Ser/Thr protein phosphatase [Tritrichomonas foetus]|eukprot:OHT04617.1 Ser/Thr protein phosphatase [Tritrichomonas foetus]